MNTTNILHTFRHQCLCVIHFCSMPNRIHVFCAISGISFYQILSSLNWWHQHGNDLNILPAKKHDMKTATYDNLKFYLVVIQLENKFNSILCWLNIHLFFFFKHFLLPFVCFRLLCDPIIFRFENRKKKNWNTW